MDLMDLQELRAQINKIDDELIDLFRRRMDISAEIARYKKNNNMPVYDSAREREILEKLAQRVSKERESSVIALYSLIFELSRAEQEKILSQSAEVV